MRAHLEKTHFPCCDKELSKDVCQNRRDNLRLTLKGRRNRSGKLEALIDSGAYASAVVRAATLIGPQRPTGLKHKRKHLFRKHYRPQHIRKLGSCSLRTTESCSLTTCNQKAILWDFFHFDHCYFIKCVLTCLLASNTPYLMSYLKQLNPIRLKLTTKLLS